LLVDTSVARNLAILDWREELRALGGGLIRVAQGVLGVGSEEPGELDGARDFFERETRRHAAGSPEYTRGLVAVMGLEALIASRSSHVEVVVPSPPELNMAIRLQDPEEREWRSSLGMKARRLDAGEAVSVAVAASRGETLGCDDDDGQIAYGALGGRECRSTLDLVKLAVEEGLLPEDEARDGYEKLRREYRFFGPPWE
jgi:predicted nucleic acid-binding protein